MEKIHKYHRQTLNKVNSLYKWVYDRTVCATELADTQNEIFAYIELSDDIKAAYNKFKSALAENNPTSSEQFATPDVTKCALPERKPSVCRHCKSDDIYFNMDAGTWVCNECNEKAN